MYYKAFYYLIFKFEKMEELLDKYRKEIIYKIKLQGIQNKTNEEILLQNFKYFDKNSTGYCTFNIFLKINQKLNIDFQSNELEKIFSYYDTTNDELIKYNDLINDIFNINNNNNINYIKNESENNFMNNSEEILDKNIKKIPPYKKPFFEKIVDNLINNELGPGVSLLILYQGFILGDKNLEGKLTLKEFVQIVNDNNINLTISDIQMLFRYYDLNNDGFFLYENLFDDLINKYIDNKRKIIIQKKSEEIMNKLIQKEKGNINLYSLQNYIFIKNINTNFFYNKLNIIDPNEYYNELINRYLGIKRILNYPRDSILTQEYLTEILNYISFGIENNDDFNKILNYIFLNEENNIKNNNNKKIKPKNNNNIQKTNEFDIYDYFRNNLIKSGLGLDIFLNIINNITNNGNINYVNKNLFGKIMKELNININNDIINAIYKNNSSINFINFIYDLINKFISKDIINYIENIYAKLNMQCLNICGKNINLNFFMQYSPCFKLFEKFHFILYEKNFEENNKKDIYDLINNKKNAKIEKDEFVLFYEFILFFNNNRQINIKNIINEHWSKVLNNKKNIIKEPEVILKIKSQLRKRGVRGLMNLHKEFIISCSDISFINLQDLFNVFNNQRISLTKEEIKKIFNLFKFQENQQYFNLTKFIRVFKKKLNNDKLIILQRCFEKFDINKNNNVNINEIKQNFNAKNAVWGDKNEEEIICEFMDCFDLNLNLIYNKDIFWNNKKKDIFINFEQFINFYEYVSFIYDNDNDFIQLFKNSWNFN